MNKQFSFIGIFVFFFVLTLVLIVLQNFYPVKNGFSFLSILLQPMQRDAYTVFANVKSSQTSEQKLQVQDQILRQQVIQLKQDNAALRDQFSLNTQNAKNLLSAHIIGMPRFIPGLTFPETIIIDQGENQGVKNNTVVVIKNMLVGKVSKVQPNLSIVSLVTNPDISLTARDIETNALGILRGIGNGKVDLENVVLSDKLVVKDIVVTKGDIGENDEGFPPQLIIGTITGVDKNPSALFQTADIQLPYDITHTDIVFLLPSP